MQLNKTNGIVSITFTYNPSFGSLEALYLTDPRRPVGAVLHGQLQPVSTSDARETGGGWVGGQHFAWRASSVVNERECKRGNGMGRKIENRKAG